MAVATSCLAAILGLTRFETKYNQKEFRFADFLNNYKSLKVTYKNGVFTSSLDKAFDFMAFDDENAQVSPMGKRIVFNCGKDFSYLFAKLS